VRALLDIQEKLAADPEIVGPMNAPLDSLRVALVAQPSVAATTGAAGAAKETKQARVLAMLRHREDVSGPQIVEAMGWAPHTFRGFLAGLAKKGIQVDVLERIRRSNPIRPAPKAAILSIALPMRHRYEPRDGSESACCITHRAVTSGRSGDLGVTTIQTKCERVGEEAINAGVGILLAHRAPIAVISATGRSSGLRTDGT
jgi:hypothetical protein